VSLPKARLLRGLGEPIEYLTDKGQKRCISDGALGSSDSRSIWPNVHSGWRNAVNAATFLAYEQGTSSPSSGAIMKIITLIFTLSFVAGVLGQTSAHERWSLGEKIISYANIDGKWGVWDGSRRLVAMNKEEVVFDSLSNDRCVLLQLMWKARSPNPNMRGWHYSRLIVIRQSEDGRITAKEVFWRETDLMKEGKKVITQIKSVSADGAKAEARVGVLSQGIYKYELKTLDLKAETFEASSN
jgi:hypothetical protein